MSAEEPGLLDVLSSLFGDESGFRCESCKNNEALVLVTCPCGWKFQGCLACLLTDASKNTYAMADAFKEHKATCEPLAKLVRVAEASRG